MKGRAVVAGEQIFTHEYICEYKCTTYNIREKVLWEEDYLANEEGSYIIEAKISTGEVMCFDATRTINSFGRLINHGLPCEVNTKPHRPLRINGEWRVGFYALRDINEGEELLYDYGKHPHQPEWMDRRRKRVNT